QVGTQGGPVAAEQLVQRFALARCRRAGGADIGPVGGGEVLRAVWTGLGHRHFPASRGSKLGSPKQTTRLVSAQKCRGVVAGQTKNAPAQNPVSRIVSRNDRAGIGAGSPPATEQRS